jgi:mannose-6-phosphate isomerase-like protein (cupin superfamily)
MIVRNFKQVAGVKKPSHGGEGLVDHAYLFTHDELDTNLQFVLLCNLEPGSSIGYHQHGENEEVYAILEGSGVMRVNDEIREVIAGDVILNKPGWSHGLENHADVPLKVLVFEVNKAQPGSAP